MIYSYKSCCNLLQEVAFVAKDGCYKLRYGRILSFTKNEQESGLPIASSTIEARNLSILPGQLISHIKRMPLFEIANSHQSSDYKTLIVTLDPIVLIF